MHMDIQFLFPGSRPISNTTVPYATLFTGSRSEYCNSCGGVIFYWFISSLGVTITYHRLHMFTQNVEIPKKIFGYRVTVLLSCIKFIFCVILSLNTNTDYQFCGTNRAKHCSADTTADICSKHGVADDEYETAEPFCEMTMSADAICAGWLTYTLTVIAANALHLWYQLYCNSVEEGFDPMIVVYSAIEKDQWNLLRDYGSRYKVTLMSFLDLWVICISWSAINVGVLCGNAFKRRDDSIVAFNFALVMMLVETSKINVTLCLKNWTKIRYYSLLYLIRIDLTILYAFVIGVHGIAFMVFAVMDGYFACLAFAGLQPSRTAAAEESVVCKSEVEIVYRDNL